MSTSEQNNGRAGQPERARPPRKSGRKKRPMGATVAIRIGQVLGTLILICLVTGCFVACYAAFYINSVIIPNAGIDLDQFIMNESSVVYYTDAETGRYRELTTLSGTEDRELIAYEDIPDVFLKAAVAIEDKRFWTHNGVDWRRTAAAVLYMFTGRDIQGGSTITQQLIKNLTENDEVTVKRKIGEIFNALETEKNYEKRDIITLYLNKIFLGQSKYGIVTASRYYFGKEVSEITLAEAASIIAITNNPYIYGPASTAVVENSDGEAWTAKQWNKYRQELVLDQMLEQELITQAEYDAAVAQELDFAFDNEGGEGTATTTTQVYSWYVEAVVDEVVDYLMETWEINSRSAYDVVYGGGLAIYTSYDPFVQSCVDEIYQDTENLPYTSRDGQQMQSAITIVDNSTGYVVAMSGRMGEKTGNLELNHAVDSPRQPGSSIKPLAAYSPAIEMGLVTPGTIIDDSPYMELEETPWPKNDGTTGYGGLTSVREGIQRSLNTIATKLVGDFVTPEASYQFLEERYGITTLVDYLERNGKILNDYGVSQLALGGLTRGLTTFEMAAAYASFPRGGAFTEPTTVLRVETKDGDLVWDNTPETEYVIKESTAWYMNEILTNAANNGTGTGALVSGQTVAGKTGTTTDNFDRWFAGYTNYYTGVVWTGYERNARITGTNGNPASRLWRQVMTLVHEGKERQSFFTLDNSTSVSICLDCGMLATDACAQDIRTVLEGVSRTQTFAFAPGDAPTSYCTCHEPITICRDDPILNEDGTPTGAYHLAGLFCPEESVAAVCIVNFQRTEIGASAEVRDAAYLTSFYESLEIADCSIHLTGLPGGGGDYTDFDWDRFNPYDLNTWPFDPYSDPSTWPFDPYDRSTWPIPDEDDPGQTIQPVDPPEVDDPGIIPPVEPAPSPDPELPPVTPIDPEVTPSTGVDYVPVN